MSGPLILYLAFQNARAPEGPREASEAFPQLGIQGSRSKPKACVHSLHLFDSFPDKCRHARRSVTETALFFGRVDQSVTLSLDSADH